MPHALPAWDHQEGTCRAKGKDPNTDENQTGANPAMPKRAKPLSNGTMNGKGGEAFHLKADDVLIQRATIQNWLNRGKEPCVMAFVLLGLEGSRATGWSGMEYPKTIQASGGES